MAESGVTVGLDIGTSSVKAVAVDDDGVVVARARVPHEVAMPTLTRMHHDALVAWHDDVLAAYASVSAGLDVAAVQVAAMVPSLCAVDEAGRPISPGLLYGDDRGWRDGGAPGANPSESGEFLGFVEWSAAHAPRAAGFWPAQAVANHALCGVGAVDSVTAMTTLPLFDFTGWDEQVAASVGVTPERLPMIVAGHQVAGTTADGALVGGGTIDAFAEQLVAGADHTGDVLVILGSTLIVWAVVDEWIEIPGLWTVPHTVPGKVLVGGPSNAGGIFTGVVDRLIAGVGGGPSGSGPWRGLDPADLPVWLPYVRGERVPLHDPTRRASLHGLGVHHSPSAVRHAAFESAGFVVREILDLAGISATRIVGTGGGTHSAEWVQSLADGAALPVDVAAVAEGGAYGAAWLARGVAGFPEAGGSPHPWARTARRVDPDPAWVDGATERYEQFRELTGPIAG